MADLNTLLTVAVVAMVFGVFHSVHGEASAEVEAVQRAGPENRAQCAFKPSSPIRIITLQDNGVYYGLSAQETWQVSEQGRHNKVGQKVANYAGIPADADAGFSLVWPWQKGWSKHTYIFKGSQYWMLINNVVQPTYPRSIKDNWGGIESVDATLVIHPPVQANRLYLFKGSQFWQWDISKDKMMPGYPKSISSLWRNLPSNLNGAMEAPNGQQYFLKGRQYYKLYYAYGNAQVTPVPSPFSLC